VSDCAKDLIQSSVIRDDIFGSDHCPVVLEMDLSY
jgi:exonuclease III